MSQIPVLSIIVASHNSIGSIDLCLGSLSRQKTEIPFEILVVDSSSDGTPEYVRQNYPDVKVLTSATRLYCGDARNIGLKEAHADLIAFLDADCHVDEDWVDSTVRVHNTDHLLVSSAVDNGSQKRILGWTNYFCEFNLWLPAGRPRKIREAAGCSLSFKRSAYDRYGPFIEGTYCSDSAFQWKAHRDGHSVLFFPHIRVYHHYDGSAREMLAHIFRHRRDFASVKSLENKLSPFGRLRQIGMLPLTPVLLMGATVLRLRRCPGYFPYLVVCSPLLFLAFCMRSIGEFGGYISHARQFPSCPDNHPRNFRQPDQKLFQIGKGN